MAAAMTLNNKIILFFILFSDIYHVSHSNAGKYSKHINIANIEDIKNTDKPFRMQKINLVWQKAQKRLSDDKLLDLYSALKIQDKEELALKHLKSSGGDKDGEKEAQLRDTLHNIMEKYSLLHYFHPEKAYQRNEFNEAIKTGDNNIQFFKDKKLNKLWEKAQLQEFSDEMLQILKTEFLHHQDKIDEYYELMDNIKNGDDYAKNMIETNMIDDGGYDYKTMNMKLKEKHKELTEGYHKLSGYAEDGIPQKVDKFTEPKVIELWNQAKNSNFSSSELESFREELSHFEHKLRKLKFYQEKVFLSTQELNKSGKTKMNIKPAEHEELELKAKHFNYKVEKLQQHIQARLAGQHSEL